MVFQPGGEQTAPLFLDWRTRHVAIGTEDAAVALLWLHLEATLLAGVEVLASVGGHRLCGAMLTTWTRDCRLQNDHDVPSLSLGAFRYRK